ncbi:hypothetical protein D3C71_25220 [compost metagenome]
MPEKAPPNPVYPATPFYNLGAKTTPQNPEVLRLKEAAHGLAEAGLIEANQLNGVYLRVMNNTTETPAEQKAAEDGLRALQARTFPLSAYEAENGQVQVSTTFFPPANTININEQQITSLLPGLSRDDNMRGAFFHELGHAVVPQEKLQALVQQVLNEHAAGDLETSHRVMAAVSPACEGKNLSVVLGEMYADTFEGLAALATDGKEAALRDIDANLQLRHNELDRSILANAMNENSNPTRVGDHHTTEALHLLRAAVSNGEAEKALSQGLGHELALEVTAQGYLREYENTRLADMNPHYFDGERLVPGLPDGVTREDLLVAEAKSPTMCQGSTGMTVLLPKGYLTEFEAAGGDIGGSARVGSGELAGHDLVVVAGTTLPLYAPEQDKPVAQYQGRSADITYLAQHVEHMESAKEAGIEHQRLHEAPLDPAQAEDSEPRKDSQSTRDRVEHEAAAAQEQVEAEAASMDM